jgi:hypothetical protein
VIAVHLDPFEQFIDQDPPFILRGRFPRALRYAEALFTAAPTFFWDSSSVSDWAGPPVLVLFFEPRSPDG